MAIMAATSNHVDTPGLRIHYLQQGTGTPVVLLHGFPETSHQWRHQIAALAEAGFACFAPDNRGFGRTDKPRTRISRGLLARDVARFMDAVGLESAHVVGHDWGGIIAFKVVADHPARVRSVTLIDTLCTVWAPRAVHGYWFKAPGLAEEFFARHHREFIEGTFGGGFGGDDGDTIPGRPEAAFRFRPGIRPRPDWVDADTLDHYRDAFADPDSHFAAIQYYRYGLPFHAIEENGALTPLDEREVAEMWLHPEGLEAHPRWARYMDYGPEDRTTRFPRPALWLHSRPVGKAPTADAAPPDPTEIPRGNPFFDQFSTYFPDLRARTIAAGHFLGEEAPAAVNESLLAFFRGPAAAGAAVPGGGT